MIAGVYSGQKLFWAARRHRNEQRVDFANFSFGYELNPQQIQIQYHISCHYATLLTNSMSPESMKDVQGVGLFWRAYSSKLL